MNLRAAQVKIIQEYIQGRIAENKAKHETAPEITKPIFAACSMELQGVYNAIDYACEFGAPEKEGK